MKIQCFFFSIALFGLLRNPMLDFHLVLANPTHTICTQTSLLFQECFSDIIFISKVLIGCVRLAAVFFKGFRFCSLLYVNHILYHCLQIERSLRSYNFRIVFPKNAFDFINHFSCLFQVTSR